MCIYNHNRLEPLKKLEFDHLQNNCFHKISSLIGFPRYQAIASFRLELINPVTPFISGVLGLFCSSFFYFLIYSHVIQSRHLSVFSRKLEPLSLRYVILDFLQPAIYIFFGQDIFYIVKYMVLFA